MKIEVKDPKFIRDVLKDEVVERVRYLVSQGIAYDDKWRDGFVELFQVIDELEQPSGDKLNDEALATSMFGKRVEGDLFKKGDLVTVGGNYQNVWTVEHHAPGDDHVVIKQVAETGETFLDNAAVSDIILLEFPIPKALEPEFRVGDKVIKGKYGRIEWTILEIRDGKVRLEATLENGTKRLALSKLDMLKKVEK